MTRRWLGPVSATAFLALVAGPSVSAGAAERCTRWAHEAAKRKHTPATPRSHDVPADRHEKDQSTPSFDAASLSPKAAKPSGGDRADAPTVCTLDGGFDSTHRNDGPVESDSGRVAPVRLHRPSYRAHAPPAIR